MFTVTFKGGAQTTTGSMHLVEVNGLRILLDCGLYQGHRKEAFERNRQLGVEATSIDCVLLSHAHIDHSGNLPSLVRAGYRGPIYTTEATRDLCNPMLRDCAYINAHDVEIVNRRRKAEGKKLFEPLYSEADVVQTLSQMEGVPYKRAIDLGNGVGAVFHNAGHILGSALVEILVLQPNRKVRRLLFSGDLGQPGQPIIPPPDIPPSPDVLLVESTYADRVHPPRENITARLRDYILDIVQQKSKLVIPAFSVGRTQQILFFLNELLREKRIPQVPIYVDSPLSLKATQIYARHKSCYGERASELLRQGIELFRMPGLEFLSTAEQSKALNNAPGPMIIIAASGMCEGGRILHHLQNTISDPRNIILIVGYQAEGTLGRRIVELTSPLRILGDEFELNARVHTINALSAHADKDALRAWVKAINPEGKVKHVFAVHGELEKVTAMCSILREEGYSKPIAPAPGAVYKGL
ncbi:MAG: MBL fold metallo-hydrolase [Kiritimatiellae bacterium]|nr:MBL fold metallo-hydrolase [Kiritimatiellia bacterium]